MSESCDLNAFGLSDPGCVRPNNEDCFISDEKRGIFVLADGMGGAKAGEHASQMSASHLYAELVTGQDNRDCDFIVSAFDKANQLVWQAAQTHSEFAGMGTTLVAVRRVAPRQFEFGSVGDSRAYQLSRSRLTQLTSDQTWVAEVGSRLGLTDEALKAHPMRHVLTMAVGVSEQVRVQTGRLALEPGDQLLLSSDGLHGVVPQTFVEQILNCQKTLEEKCHYLVDAAKQNGGPDNVTVVLIQLL